MRSVPVSYVPGGAYGLCMRCGFKFRLSELRKEWSGLLVCNADFDPLPDTMKPPRNGPEGMALADASPEPPDTFITQPVRPEDL